MNEAVPPPEPPWGAEIRRSLEGAFRLFLFDSRAMQLFTPTITGFWRSFFAGVVGAPLFAMILILQAKLVRANGEAPASANRIGAELLGYPLSVVLFPIAMIGLARLLKVTGRYVPYIIAYNWAAIVTGLVALIPLLLFGVGLLDAQSGLAALMTVNLVIVVYLWFVARAGLGVSGLTAAGLVMIDVLLNLLSETLLDQLAG